MIAKVSDEYDELRSGLQRLADRVSRLEEWRNYWRGMEDARAKQGTSLSTWVAIASATAIGMAGLLWQIIMAGRTP